MQTILRANKEAWQPTLPDDAGDWEMKCSESDFEPEVVTIFQQDGALWVIDPHVGTSPLDHYHGNLCQVGWRKVAHNPSDSDDPAYTL